MAGESMGPARRPGNNADDEAGIRQDADEVINMISETSDHIPSTVDEKKIKAAADTGACAHCLGPDDLPDGMMVEQCAQRNFCGPCGKPTDTSVRPR